MGWQDDPVVSNAPSQPAWASDPIVSDANAPVAVTTGEQQNAAFALPSPISRGTLGSPQ